MLIYSQSYDSFEISKIFIDENERANILNESLNDEKYMEIYFIKNDIYKSDLIEQNKNEKNTEPDSNQNNKIPESKNNMNNNEEEKNIKIQKDINIKKKGRIKKVDINNKIVKHDKLSEDNIIRKLKRYILDYIILMLNQSIKFKSGKFRPLNKIMKERLKRDENVELLNKTIANIFSNTKMNKVSEKKRKSNKDLIEKIYNENIEKETIKILNMSFQEILNEIRDKYLDYFLSKIKEKEIKIENKKDFDIEEYINNAKNLLLNFEDYFRKKKGRNRIKNGIK